MKSYLSLSLSLLLSFSLSALAQDKPAKAPAPAPKSNPLNEPVGDPGVIPADTDGKPLNLNFEDGTLKDWKAEGKAFDKQPVKGEISQTRVFGEGKKAEHTGQFWLGGFEVLFDPPVGTLTSVPFEITQPFGSFLIGGGSSKETRVELVTADDNKVFFATSGQDQENLRPVILDLQKQKGKKIFIRIVDAHTGGWGHVNFDDFRLHKERPRFKSQVANSTAPAAETLYPHAGLSAEEAVKEMVVPPGFKVQVAAAEPDVQQPIAMAIDDRGRIWIAEAFTYPTRAKDGEGKDRIIILEDTDLDGKLDKRTVFIEGLNLVSGMEIGFGGVWVGAAPYLLFIPDKNGDDVPDGIPMKAEPPMPEVKFPLDVPPGTQVLLDGWGYEDTHETLNSFIWGPDGWLYGCHGVFTHSAVGKPGTPKEKRTKINAGIWRYHPVRHQFEVFAEGTSNPWGLDYDQYGNFFATACVIPHCYHIIPGARYERQAGNHFNPYTYDDIKTIADHRHYTGNQWNDDNRRQSDEVGGGHAHAGCMIYQGGAWPEKYRGMLFMNNIHGNRMNMDILTPKGSGFVCSHGPDFLLTRDQWSQMLYMTYGPDGQVWVIDWYDRQQCHLREPDKHDRSNGRIYRIVYNDAKPVKVDLQKMKDEELVKLLEHDNVWYARHAQRLILERIASRKFSADGYWKAIDSGAKENKESTLRSRIRGPWKYSSIGGIGRVTETLLEADNQESIQKTGKPIADRETSQAIVADTVAGAITRQGQDTNDGSIDTAFRELYNGDVEMHPLILAALSKAAESKGKSASTRLALASAIQRVEPIDRFPILEQLTSHAEDASDPNLPLMYWYAMEPLADVDPKRALALGLSAGEKIPILKEYMIRRIGAGDPKKSLALLVEGLRDAKDDATRLTFLRGMNESLKGRKGVEAPAGWNELFVSLIESKNIELRMQLTSVGAGLGDKKVIETLRRMIGDDNSSLQERREAIKILVRAQDAAATDSLRFVLSNNDLRGDALRALAVFDDPKAPAAILALYDKLPPTERRDALATLCSRVGYAKELLGAIESKKIPANHLTADLVTNLRNLNDADLQKLLEKSWGTARETAADKKKLIEDYKKLLDQGATGVASTASVPDVQLGRAVFARTCQQCHTLFGTGGKVGPDITGSQRANLDYLLSNVLDPSAVMAKEYQPTIARLDDGRVVTGILKAENGATVTLLTQTETLVIPVADIEERKISDKSMMPDDLLKPLTSHEVRSLVAYVSSPGQTPMLATTDNVATFYSGKDLAGWRGDEKLWSVENGEIVGKTEGLAHNTWLVNELSVSDFRLELDVKLVKNEGNSGIQIRSQPMANGEVKGYQADVGAGWWGKLYEEHGRALLWDKSGEAHVKNGDWNRYEIVCVGSRTQTWINGQPCVDLDDPQGARRGIIALQLHSGGKTEVRFKNLKLTLLTGIEKSGPYPTSKPLEEGQKLSFKRTKLSDKFHSEGVAYGDFNNDGLLDIAAGSVWYERPNPKAESGKRKAEGEDAKSAPAPSPQSPAPAWKMHSILEKPKEFDIKTYSDTFMNWAEDLDGDGKQDLIVVDFPGQPTWWFQNPGSKGGPWARNRMVPVTNNESPQYLDVDKDGKRELIYGDGTKRLALARPGATPLVEWSATRVAAPGEVDMPNFYHGLGVGDVNKDGRDDLVVPHGWWEAPEKQTSETWPFHAAPLGEAQAQMQVYDFDGDGDADVLGSSAHRRGIWWYEQQPENKWVKHEIDTSIAQTHAMVLADINGDGLPDFVTGKRYYAHNGRDPGEDEPPVIAWYELSRKDGKPVWTQHVFDHDSGVGTAFEVHDMNGDGLQDVIVANKRGVFYFEQTRE